MKDTTKSFVQLKYFSMLGLGFGMHAWLWSGFGDPKNPQGSFFFFFWSNLDSVLAGEKKGGGLLKLSFHSLSFCHQRYS